MHNSVIIGPCYIGKNTIIRVGAVIYENCSFGEYCKIGGELENTIFHNYSNKQHSGFIGNSYIGEWVNLGANTNNSDLKNNYSDITIQLPHKKIKTGKKFLGFLCGDHTKTAINSTILTGSVLGTSVMLALAKFSPKLVSSFSWLTDEFVEKYDFERAISTMQIVKYRRNKELFSAEIEMLRSVF
jgi:UDP-N-acetylglucosamine diphosphorylase/glucosamine-1-phosphate N-acetyltransferase